MPDTKISGLPDGSPALATDQIPINRAGANFRVNASTFGAISFPGVPTGPCLPNQTAVNSGTGDYYSCSSGSWVKVGPTAGSLVSPITSPNPINFDVEMHFKGPDPYVDVTRYGVRATATNVAPAIPGVTATINSSSTSATISAASSFQNGDGVVIFGAGAANNVTTPTGLAVTPSVASGPTGMGLAVNGPSGGATAYAYTIIARDKNGGLSAAPVQVSISNGAASLGPQNVVISGWTRSGTTVTATTSSAHGLAIGAVVFMAATANQPSDDLNFGGWFVVASVADNTHFTYQTGQDSAAGAATASVGGGTAYWWNCNHLTWTSQPNAYQYYIYGRTSGSLTYIGTSRVQSTVNGLTPDTTFDDFGSPTMDGAAAPYFVPTTPPGSAISDPLVTTIVSGAGTTTLVLANTASTSVSGATILFDNAPNIATAASHATSSSILYFPVSVNSYVTNSYLTIPGSVSIQITGSILLNDTMELHSSDKIFGMLGAQSASSLSFGYPVGGFITGGRANPAIYGGNASDLYFYGIQIVAGANGAVGLLLDQVPASSFNFMNFTGSGNSDTMTIPFMIRVTDFLVSMDHVALITGQGAFYGLPPTPAMSYDGGNITLSNLSLSGRGIFFNASNGGSGVDMSFHGARMQGGTQPFFTIYVNNQGALGGNITFSNVELDTMPHALFANVSATNYVGLVTINDCFTGPANSFGYLTGKPVGFVSTNMRGFAPLFGQNISLQQIIDTLTFANLGTPGNGTFVFCPDCTIANPCAGSGTGAFAKRLNGVWVCN